MFWPKETCSATGKKCVLNFTFTKPIKDLKYCDVFIGEKDFVFCCGNMVKRFHCKQKFDREQIDGVEINFNSVNSEFSCELPCYVDDECKEGSINCPDEVDQDDVLLKLTRVTDDCKILRDKNPVRLENRFSYGFGCQLDDDTSLVQDALRLICKISNPSSKSSVARTIKREKDELRDFCESQYKINFFELQIPEGFENPMKYSFKYEDTKLTTDEEYILNNLKKKKFTIPEGGQPQIDCGLISILLAICYDLRTTSGEPTCESGWTRTILSSFLSYFEPLENLKTVLDVFLRRSITYPMYRNYELGRLCIDDTVEALHRGPAWITKHLMVTYDLFKTSADSRQLLNKYYIEDYICYVIDITSNEYLKTLSKNLKNVSLDIKKKQLRLNLINIEGELLKELLADIHLGYCDSDDESTVHGSSSEDSDDVEDEDEDDDEDEDSSDKLE